MPSRGETLASTNGAGMRGDDGASPIVKELLGAPDEPIDHEADVNEVLDLPQMDEEVEMATDENVTIAEPAMQVAHGWCTP